LIRKSWRNEDEGRKKYMMTGAIPESTPVVLTGWLKELLNEGIKTIMCAWELPLLGES